MKKGFSQLLPWLLVLPVVAVCVGLWCLIGADVLQYLKAAIKLVVIP